MNNDKKLILIAEESPTASIIFKTLLEQKGYKTVTVHDGFTAIDALSNNKFDAVAFSNALPVYDGFQLAQILSTTPDLSSIPIVIYALEKTSVYNFWQQNTHTDVFCTLTENKPEQLCDAIEEALKIDKRNISSEINQNSITAINSKEILSQSYTSDLFDLYLTRTTLEAEQYFNDMHKLVFKMIKLLSGVCGYDAVCLIINNKNIYEYTDLSCELSEEEKKDFLLVSHSDFRTHSMINRNYEPVQISISPSNIISRADTYKIDSSKLKLKSYECFEIMSDKFLGTLHIGHTRQDYFTDRTQTRCLLYTEKLTQILDHLLYTRNLINAEKTMRRAFARFVPEQIIEDLVKTGNAFNDTLSENRNIAILISDIRNFTNISEINSPETVVTFLNYYFSRMCEIIKKHGGIIDKFMGDAVMALFGATVSYNDNSQRAVKAALEMQEELANIDISQLTMPPHIKFDIGIGIHYGNVIVGSIGSKDKSDFTAIGDTVNITSRIESLNKRYGTNIIISDSVRANLKEKFTLRLLDSVKLKGKSKSVKVYSVETNPSKFPKSYTLNYLKGINAYTIGGWRLAASYFEKALQIIPEETAAKLLWNRCNDFLDNPPENWDGAVNLTTK